MNLANKITMGRIILSIIILIFLLFPFYIFDYTFPKYLIAGKVLVDTKYFIAGGLFIIAACSDFLDGYIARSRHQITDYGKTMDAIADKVLVNGLLIILSTAGFINVLIPVIIICRDIAVDSIKMVAAAKKEAVPASILGKLKTIFMMVGIALILFYNLPFELLNLRIADLLILAATVLSIVSGVDYYLKFRKLFIEK